MWGSIREEVISALEGSKVIVLVHGNADLDAVGSALAVCRAIEGSSKRCCVIAPEGISSAARSVLRALSIDIPFCDEARPEHDVVITVDASSVSQLGGAAELLGSSKVIVFDHHERGSLHDRADILIADSQSPTCVEVVLSSLPGSVGRLKGSELTLMIAAILEESGMLERARPSTLRLLADLIERGGDYDLARSLVKGARTVDPIDVRMARLKGVSRVKVGRACGTLLVAVTNVGSYEAEVARSLLSIGADVAIVVNEPRVSIRISRLAESYGINASELASRLASYLGGEGGGHRGAAALRYSGTDLSLEGLLSTAINYLNNMCKGGGSGVVEGSEGH